MNDPLVGMSLSGPFTLPPVPLADIPAGIGAPITPASIFADSLPGGRLGSVAAKTGIVPGPADATPRATEADLVHRSKILILDDEPYNIVVVRKYLREAGYANLVSLTDSTEALKTIRQEAPSLLILDIDMPEVTGLDLLRLRCGDDELQRLPVLILTVATDAATKRAALDLGATDFLSKPVDPNDLLPRVRNTLVAKAYQDRQAHYMEQLEWEVARRTAQLEASRAEIIQCLARAAEYHDNATGRHVNRVGHYVAAIARATGFTAARAAELQLAAQLHDVGKIAVPDAILNSTGKLDPEVIPIVQKHSLIGRQILAPMPTADWDILRQHAELGASMLGVPSSPLLVLAATIAMTHHEWWDGTGYPLGLAGEDIPVEGRITAVADVFDALSSPRPYKRPIPREKCLAMMEEERGTHFDPAILDAFYSRREEIVRIQLDFAENA